MSISITVTWKNPNHQYLPEKYAAVSITTVPKVKVDLISSKPGQRIFEIKDPITRLEALASFEAEFGPVNQGSKQVLKQRHEVLRAEQHFSIQGTKVDTLKMSTFDGPHPLVIVHTVSNQNIALHLEILTDFVNLQPFWEAFSVFPSRWIKDVKKGKTIGKNTTFPIKDHDFMAEYKKNKEKDMDFVTLGFTGGAPRIWYTCAHKNTFSNDKTGCFVFHRPSPDDNITFKTPHSQYTMNRYLLAPNHGETDEFYWRSDHLFPFQVYDGSPYPWLCAGFEQAIVNSKRCVVLVYPWPGEYSITNNPPNESTKNIKEKCEKILRCLFALSKETNKKSPSIHPQRIALGAYSAGGSYLQMTVNTNKEHINEIYCFDAVRLNLRSLFSWLISNPQNRLRMSWSHRNPAKFVVRRTKVDKVPIEISFEDDFLSKIESHHLKKENLTIYPAQQRDYDYNPAWNHIFEINSIENEFEKMRTETGKLHEFTLYGAMPTLNHETDFSLKDTNFLQQFLEMSDFPFRS
jgi:hypothetical protein